MDIVDTRSDVARVSLVDEDLEKLGVGFGVLDGEDISIKSSNGVEEVLELRVAEVGMDLSGILNTSSGELEAVDSPLQVGIALLARAKGQTFTKGWLVNLNDVNAILLKVNNLVTEGKGKLLGLNRLVDVDTREGPPKASNGSSKHTLHRLLRDRGSVLALLDSHSSGAGDITDNDRGTNASRSVRLDPSVGRENVTLESLSEVLHHVVTLGLTVHVDVKAKLILNLDALVDLAADECVILLLSDLTLGELVSLDSDLLSLGEGADSGRREEGNAEVLLLLSIASLEWRLAVVHLRSDLALAFLNLGVVGTLRFSTRLDGSSVGVKLGLNRGRAFGNSLGKDRDFTDLLDGEGEPLVDFLGQLLLVGEGVGNVEEGAGSSNNDTLLAEGADGGVEDVKSLLEVVLPDVTSVNDTSRQNLLGTELLDNRLKLLGVANQINVNTLKVGKSRQNIEVVNNVSKVSGHDELRCGSTEGSNGLVGRLESSLDLGSQIENKNRLVDLNIVCTSSLESLEKLDIHGDKLVNQGNGVDGGTTVGLSQSKERDRSQNNGSGIDSGLLGLEELPDGLRVLGQGESLAILNGGLGVVVVAVKPFHHLQRGHINTTLLVTTAHGEVLVEGAQFLSAVTLRNSTEELDVVKDLVVVREVIGRDDVDTGILLDLPVSSTESLSLSQEISLRDLVRPVSLSSLLEVSQGSHTGETQNGRLNHCGSV